MRDIIIIITFILFLLLIIICASREPVRVGVFADVTSSPEPDITHCSGTYQSKMHCYAVW